MYLFQSQGLKKMRLDAKLSQGKLSDALGLGSPQFMSNIENGKASIPSKMIPALSATLNVEPGEIVKLKIIDYILELSESTGTPDVRIYAKKILDYEKQLKKLVETSDIQQLYETIA